MMDKKPDAVIIDYQQTFNSPAGRRVLVDLLHYSKLLDQPNEAITSEMLFVMEGRRHLVGHILRMLDKTPAEILTIRQQREQMGKAYE